jgi:hypothetical protein
MELKILRDTYRDTPAVYVSQTQQKAGFAGRLTGQAGNPASQQTMRWNTPLGLHVVGHDERGAIVLRQKWSRGQVEARFASSMPNVINRTQAAAAGRGNGIIDKIPAPTGRAYGKPAEARLIVFARGYLCGGDPPKRSLGWLWAGIGQC